MPNGEQNMSEELLLQARSIINERPDEALAICNDILNDHIDDDIAQKALFMSGYIMMDAERFGLAYNIYQRCAQLNPKLSSVWSNMGMCLEEYSPAKAKKCFKKAYFLDNRNADALANEGLMCLQSGQPERCIELSQKALIIKPELKAAKHNMGLAQLMLRQWKEGWANYHDTLGVKHREGRDYGIPDWNGETGTIVVYGEQGVGDEIMFSTCLHELAKTNDIILDCDARLERLFKRSFDFPVYGTRFKRETPILDDHSPDYQLAIGQLPYFYRNSEESFTGAPHLVPDPDRVIQWEALFKTFKGKKVGIAWRGGLKNTGESKRSLNLDDLLPLFNDQDTFISLEYKPVEQRDLDRYNIKSYPETSAGGDIDALAALVSQLDYVVSSCTTIIYIAGALGIPCYVLTPACPGYRYHSEGDFPWFNSVHLVRQKGTWLKTVEGFVSDNDLHRF